MVLVVLAVSLAACASPPDPLTEPGHDVSCSGGDLAVGPVDFTGLYSFEWMCFGQSNQFNCEPAENPLLSVSQLRIEAATGTDRRVSIGATSFLAIEEPEGNWLTFPPAFDSGQLRRGGHIYTCLDGRTGMRMTWDLRAGDGANVTFAAELTK